MIISAPGPDNPVSRALTASVRRLLNVVIFSGLINLLTLSGSLYMLQVYDRVIPSKDAGTLAGLSGLVLLAYLLQGYLDALRSRMLARISAQFDTELQIPLYSALAALPLTGATPGEVQQPLRDLDQVRAFLAGAGPTAFMDMPWMPIFLIVLFLFHPVLGLTAVAGAMAIIALTLLADRQSAARSRRTAVAAAERQLLADATRAHADVIRALGMQARLSARWAMLNERMLTESLSAMEVHANLGAGGKVLRYCLQSAMLGLGALLVVNDQASGGIMIASSIVMGRALAPIEVALASWRQLSAARTGLGSLRSALATHGTVRASTGALIQRPHRVLTVSNVSVTIPGTPQPIVSGISFTLRAGLGLALIGPSGSGKSTLLRALAGIWPAAGDVRLDGARLQDFGADGPGAHLGYLPQDVGLFDGTIEDNIARFDPVADEQLVLEAARISGAHDLISTLPHGYRTRIGQGGSALSAGQRQRIGLARAVYGNPFLILLDEPNANLDAEGEIALTRAIWALKQRGSAVIVVSHRASALEALDGIMVLVGGRIMTMGSRAQVEAELRAKSQARAAA